MQQRGNYFVIDNIDSLPELKQGFTVELFRLKTKIENKQYFEIAEHVKVLNPYTEDIVTGKHLQLNQIPAMHTAETAR